MGRTDAVVRILAGLCANPSVIGHNARCGWKPVNCTEQQLVEYAEYLADLALSLEKACLPVPALL